MFKRLASKGFQRVGHRHHLALWILVSSLTYFHGMGIKLLASESMCMVFQKWSKKTFKPKAGTVPAISMFSGILGLELAVGEPGPQNL